jgi:hypothetical protein
MRAAGRPTGLERGKRRTNAQCQPADRRDWLGDVTSDRFMAVAHTRAGLAWEALQTAARQEFKKFCRRAAGPNEEEKLFMSNGGGGPTGASERVMRTLALGSGRIARCAAAGAPKAEPSDGLPCEFSSKHYQHQIHMTPDAFGSWRAADALNRARRRGRNYGGDGRSNFNDNNNSNSNSNSSLKLNSADVKPLGSLSQRPPAGPSRADNRWPASASWPLQLGTNTQAIAQRSIALLAPLALDSGRPKLATIRCEADRQAAGQASGRTAPAASRFGS